MRDKSFYAGPSFGLDYEHKFGRYKVKCQGKVHGYVKPGAEIVALSSDGEARIGSGYKSLRQAGIAVLKNAGVKGELEGGH